MLTLYVKTGCPYCAKVLAEVEVLQLKPTIKNIATPGIPEELLAIGGQQREPFMIDDDANTKLYGSEEIVVYLHEHFGKK
jgi:glutathione S-transferase